MPYLQFDLPGSFPADTKRRLAERIGDLYCDIMRAQPGIVNVGFREMGAENLYRTGKVPVQTVAMAMLDIRAGRSLEQRVALARALTEACEAFLGIPAGSFTVEFTQHAGSEAYRGGVVGADWTPGEADLAPRPTPAAVAT